jgi:hypothetical protein
MLDKLAYRSVGGDAGYAGISWDFMGFFGLSDDTIRGVPGCISPY